MTLTRIMPSVRLCITVCSVKCSRSLRSSMGTTFTPGGRMPLLSCIHLLVNCLERRLLFRALAHQHDALDDIRLVDDAPILHVVGSGHVAQADFRTLGHFRDVFHAKRGSGLRL